MKSLSKVGIRQYQIFFAFCVFIFYSIQVFSQWSLVRISGYSGRSFGDSFQVISAATCDQEGTSNLYVYNPQNPDCYYTYGRALLKVLQFLHISVEDLQLVGYAAVVLTLLLCTLPMFSTTNRKNIFVSALVTCSPGVWLLLERGNFDWLIFCLVFLAGYASLREKQVLSSLLIIVSALFKFYTFPLLIVPFLKAKRKSKWVISLSSAIALPFCIYDFRNADVENLVFTFTATFGVNWMGLVFNETSNRLGLNITLESQASHLIGIMVSITLLLLVNRPYIKSSIRKKCLSAGLHKDPIFVLFSLTFVSCYLAGSNFDYRLIFLVGAIARALSLFREDPLSDSWYLVAIGSTWLTYAYFGISNQATEFLRIMGNLCQYFIFITFSLILKDLIMTLRKKSNP